MDLHSGNGLIWVNNFDSDATKSFYEDFFRLEELEAYQAIFVLINSYGGELFSLVAMRDLIKTSNKPVATSAIGHAMSCGASLLAAGHKGMRSVSRDTQVLIHQVSSGAFGKTSDMVASTEHLKKLNDMILMNLAEDTGNSIEKLKKEIKHRENTDWILTSDEAVKWGLADYVGIPRQSSLRPHVDFQLFVDKKTEKDMLAKAALKNAKKNVKKKGK